MGCLQPTAELLAKLPNIATAQWEIRKDRIAAERRILNTKFNEQKTLNQKGITAFLNGTLSEEDLQAIKNSVNEQMQLIQEQLRSLKTEEVTMEALMEETREQIMNLAATWQKSNLNVRKELQFALFPDGLRYSPEKRFFEPQNRSLMIEVKSFVDKLVNGDWARKKRTALKRLSTMVAGACNHPNVPSIHFRFTIQPNHIRRHKTGPNRSKT